jgi:hypothetical protein
VGDFVWLPAGGLSLPSSYIALELHRFGACDEPTERLASTLAEPHPVVCVAATLVQECIAFPPEMVCSTAKILLASSKQLRPILAADLRHA